MTTDEVIDIAKELGCAFFLDPHGVPNLQKPKDNDPEVPVLLEVLKLEPHRSEIIRRLQESAGGRLP